MCVYMLACVCPHAQSHIFDGYKIRMKPGQKVLVKKKPLKALDKIVTNLRLGHHVPEQ